MNMVDNHVHTHFSSDGKDIMERVIKEAINIGVDYLTFTDHMEYNVDKFSIDFEKYFNQINLYKDKYKKDITLLSGIEIGYQKHLKNEIDNIINKYPFDFVLCSTHTIDKINVPDPKYFEGYSKYEAYTKYFESILETATNFTNYDVYGHLDYIIRYGNYEDKRVIYDDYRDVLDILLNKIISMGRGIEVNTSGYRYGVDSVHPNMDILKRYKELGGQIITVGSDSHRSIDVCKDFNKAYDMLRYIGFKYVCIFTNRAPIFINIGKDKVGSIA